MVTVRMPLWSKSLASCWFGYQGGSLVLCFASLNLLEVDLTPLHFSWYDDDHAHIVEGETSFLAFTPDQPRARE